MRAIARFATHRPVVVLLGWIAIVVGIQAWNAAAGPDLRDEFALEGTDSQAAYDLLQERFPAEGGTIDTVVWSPSSGSVTDEAVVSAVSEVLDSLAQIDHVTMVVSPYDPASVGQISQSGTVAFARVQYDETAYNLPISTLEEVAATVAEADGTDVGGATLTIAHGGFGAQRLSDPEVGAGELVGLAIAAVILFFAFGSLIAATVPLISAIVALGATLGTIGLISNLGPMATTSPMLAVLLGLGIGIDYALFIVNRHRLGLKAGRDVRESVIAATTTSGRAVVFAGTTVFIALSGMYVPGIQFLSNLATAAAITVVFAVAASVSLVPALLTLYGTRVLGRHDRARLAAGVGLDSVPTPGRASRFVERHPLSTSVAAVAVLGVIAIPMFGLRLGNADAGNDPDGSPTRVAYDLIAEGFGAGSNGPLVIVVDLEDNAPYDPAAPPAALAGLVSDLQDDPAVAAVLPPQVNPAGDTLTIQVIPVGSPQDAGTQDLVHRVRDEYAPAAEGLTIHVGGSVASNIDFTEAISSSLPLFFTMVVGFSVLVLVVAFRSLVLPIVGALLNILSAAAAFGVVVAVFQWGWGHQLIGIGPGGPIEPFAPVILFALLFGLSMDYQVFLVSRIAELWHATGDNALAVRRGLAEVSRVIMAAASIMVVVFGSFVTSDSRILKLMGLGLASAVFLDAFVIRVILMPSVMRVLGRWNWWIPRWLDRILPHVDIDGDDHASREDRALFDATSGRT